MQYKIGFTIIAVTLFVLATLLYKSEQPKFFTLKMWATYTGFYLVVGYFVAIDISMTQGFSFIEVAKITSLWPFYLN